MIRLIETFFLKGGSATRLGVCRALFYGWFLVQIFVYDPVSYVSLPSEFWSPTLLLRVVPPPTVGLMAFATILAGIAALLSCLGFLTRISTAIVALAGTYIFGAINGYGHVTFHFAPMILVSWILPFSPCGDAFSLDCRFARLSSKTSSMDYQWPVRLAQIALVLLFFTAACQKLDGNWLEQPVQNMRHWLLYKYYMHAKLKGEPLSASVLFITRHSWVLLIMACVMLLSECFSPLALLDRWPIISAPVITSLFMMQFVLSTWLQTLPSFPWLGGYLFFVPWEKLLAASQRIHCLRRIIAL